MGIRIDRVLGSAVALAAFVAVTVPPSRAPATLDEQRERLPPPASGCGDPVEGLWQAYWYADDHQKWFVESFEVRRDPSDTNRLATRYRTESWAGGPRDSRPPSPCRAGDDHAVADNVGTGTFEDGVLAITGTRHTNFRTVCGNRAPPRDNSRFATVSGRVDVRRQEFQSTFVGRSCRHRIVYRRIACAGRSVSFWR